MDDSTVIDIAIQAMLITAKLAAPILIVSLAIGVAVSLVQSVTQVQEYTLSFVPKLAGIAVVIVVAGSWMLHQLVAFTQDLFARVPTLVR
jgi:flagellar biosynthetic protein FliQ